MLANKDNDATLRLAEIVNGSDTIVNHAHKVSKCGEVKAASLADAIFNHKDDKKGQQDMHVLFFQDIKAIHNITLIVMLQWNFLNTDPPTLIKLAVLTMYSQTMTKLYMQLVQAPGMKGLNILDLGPLHESLKYHIWSIIINPGNVLCCEPDAFTVATFGSRPFNDPEAIKVVLSMYLEGHFPHFINVLVTFFTGALAMW
ncbi:hypothetical protein F5I97DRAFT_1832633 [Phlebopus sp. FC_14]|nr:hypothetical protein F5I97DRAFT_1832633 [Phlebopus sp. FC_14]